MISGRKSKSIQIETVTQVVNAFGGLAETWATFKKVFAEVSPTRGQEYFSSRQINTKNNVSFRFNYFSGITTKMRVSYDGKVYDIQSIININERNREIELMCEEQV